MRHRLLPVLICIMLSTIVFVGPVGASTNNIDPGLTLADKVELNIGVLLQPRFEYESRDSDNTVHTSFSAQRVRTTFKGQAYTPHLSYKVLAEFAQSPTLLEGWVEYGRFDPYTMRLGQTTVPFNRERDIPVTKLLTTQRSLANAEFNWPTGRDIGFMVSKKRTSGLEYRLGVFSGESRNSTRSSSNGVLTSGRATYEILGDYERSESFYQVSESTNLTMGVGLQYAYKNTARDWFSRAGATGADTSNVTAATLDLQLRSGAWNLSGSYFHRNVEDYTMSSNNFDGQGFTIQGGYVLSPNFLYLSARHSQVHPNDTLTTTRSRGNTLGLHLFQKGNRAQVRFEAGQRQNKGASDWVDDSFARIQQQLYF
ncbi:MAG: hypothetical protein ABEK50_16005 [bacterium]